MPPAIVGQTAIEVSIGAGAIVVVVDAVVFSAVDEVVFGVECLLLLLHAATNIADTRTATRPNGLVMRSTRTELTCVADFVELEIAAIVDLGAAVVRPAAGFVERGGPVVRYRGPTARLE